MTRCGRILPREHRARADGRRTATENGGRAALRGAIHATRGVACLSRRSPGRPQRGRMAGNLCHETNGRSASTFIDTGTRAGGGLGTVSRGYLNVSRSARVNFHFQPIRRLWDGGIIGFEALARFPGEHGPSAWLQEAYRSGHIATLDRLLFVSAVRLFHTARLQGRLFVNVEAGDLDQVPLWLREAGLADEKARLIVEVTERSPPPPDGWGRACAHFHQEGVPLALDDFRFTMSFVRHVVRLRPAYVKLDRSVLHALDQRRRLGPLLSRFQARRAELIAEGVQDQDQTRRLLALGIAYGQGFGLGRPATCGYWRQVARDGATT